MLEYQADPNAVTQYGETPLHYGAGSDLEQLELWYQGMHLKADQKTENQEHDISSISHAPISVSAISYREIVKLLLQYGADPNAINQYKTTPLHYAMDNCDTAIVKSLLEQGANPNAATLNGNHPLRLVSRDSECVALLLQYGADPNGLDGPDGQGHPDWTVGLFDLKNLKLLLEHGANPNTPLPNTPYVTPLNWVLEKHDSWNLNESYRNELAELLLKYNADPNAPDEYCRTPLYHATEQQSIQLVKLLLEYGANPNTECHGYISVLRAIIDQPNTDIMELLLQKGLNLNATADNDGFTPLHYAAWSGHLEIVNLLLEHHADPNIADNEGNTPLRQATECGSLKMMQLLLEHHANPDTGGQYGTTPLLYAAFDGHLEIVKLLLEHHANLDIANEGNETPLARAAWSGHLEIVKLLLEHHANPSIATNDGQTPLLCAAADAGNWEMTRILIEHTESFSSWKESSLQFILHAMIVEEEKDPDWTPVIELFEARTGLKRQSLAAKENSQPTIEAESPDEPQDFVESEILL